MPEVTAISVQKEYEKNPDINPKDIKNIRDWLKQQPHLPHEYITDLDLILAYYCCERCSDLTKKVIDLNYTLRSFFDFYQNRKVDKNIDTALHTWLITPLEMPTKNGYRAVYCQLLDADPEKFVYSDVVRAFVMLMDLWLCEEGTVPGVAVIVNMNNVSLGHLSQINLTVAQQFFYFLQEAMFVRLKEFHFINAPSLIDTLMSMVRPLMKKEMLHLLRVHQVGSNTLEEFVPIAALPREAGGESKDGVLLRDEIWKKLKANEKFFEEESKKRVDETKRPGKPRTMSSFFSGLEGTFKKLEID